MSKTLLSTICRRCKTQITKPHIQSFSSTTRRKADGTITTTSRNKPTDTSMSPGDLEKALGRSMPSPHRNDPTMPADAKAESQGSMRANAKAESQGSMRANAKAELESSVPVSAEAESEGSMLAYAEAEPEGFVPSSQRNAADAAGPSTKITQPAAQADAAGPSTKITQLAAQAANEAKLRPRAGIGPNEPYHLNVYAHKQNTHITFTDPGRDVIVSYSCGSIGLRHAQRKSFDANYQLAAYTFRKMAEKSWKIGGKSMKTATHMLNGEDVQTRGIEVVLRGYGVGREAFQKAILGSEGKMVRPLIKSVSDNTRLKFGGTRSPAVRRL